MSFSRTTGNTNNTGRVMMQIHKGDWYKEGILDMLLKKKFTKRNKNTCIGKGFYKNFQRKEEKSEHFKL